MTTDTLARCQHTNRADHDSHERLQESPLRTVVDRSEVWNCLDCGGWLHQQTELDPDDPTRTIVTFPLKVTEYDQHPAWCEKHSGHEDGSGDWHESFSIEIAGLTTVLTTGNYDRTVEIYAHGEIEGALSFSDARALGERLIALCDAAEAGQ